MSLRLIGLLSAVLTLVAGCGIAASDEDAAAPTREFAADNGTVTIPKDPKRIVVTGYAVPVLIEAGAPLVASSTWERSLELMTPKQRATYDGLTKVSGELTTEMNYEAVAEADPDLIIIGVPRQLLGELDMDRLNQTAPVVALGPTLPDGWRELSRRQSDAANRLGAYDENRKAYEEKAAKLTERYAEVLRGKKFGHVGGYGDVSAGNFQREFAGSWGTNIAGDIGVEYYGQVKEKGPGGKSVSEYPSIEELPTNLGEADAITFSVGPDGSPGAAVRYVLDSPLWQSLPAVQAGMVFPVRYTEATTYPSAMSTLDSLDEVLSPLLAR